jgi:hypothetical protein
MSMSLAMTLALLNNNIFVNVRGSNALHFFTKVKTRPCLIFVIFCNLSVIFCTKLWRLLEIWNLL